MANVCSGCGLHRCNGECYDEPREYFGKPTAAETQRAKYEVAMRERGK